MTVKIRGGNEYSDDNDWQVMIKMLMRDMK